jgi:hypothetical protein
MLLKFNVALTSKKIEKKTFFIKSTNMSCNVCVESFNKSNRLNVICNFCEYESCRECYKTYFSGLNELAHCMNCKKEWNNEILLQKFTKSFVNKTYKKHVENILFEKESVLFPATQLIIEEKKKGQEFTLEIFNLENRIEELVSSITHLSSEYEMADIKLINDMLIEIGKCRIDIKYYQGRLNNQNTTIHIKKCSIEECRGYINTDFECGLCNTQYCSDCDEIKLTDHICDNEKVETSKMIKHETKACPNCMCRIFKTEGCNQIFCTVCKIAFDWNTGKIETGQVHNPHFFEWMQNGGNLERNLLDVQCGREVDDAFISRIDRGPYFTDHNFISHLCKHIKHLYEHELPKYAGNRTVNNQDLRIKYLKSFIDKDRFKSLIYKRDKDSRKNYEIAQILQTFISCFTDIVYRYDDEIHSSDEKKNTYIVEIYKLIENTKLFFLNLSKTYNCKPYSYSV